MLSARRSDGEHEASRRVKTEFLVELDGAGGAGAEADGAGARVLFIGATNCPWDLDDALMRRLARRVHVPLPDAPARRALLAKLLEKGGARGGGGGGAPRARAELDALVRRTEGYSCADVCALAAEAALAPIRELGDAVRAARAEDVRAVATGDFLTALAVVRPSVPAAALKRYLEWDAAQGLARSS